MLTLGEKSLLLFPSHSQSSNTMETTPKRGIESNALGNVAQDSFPTSLQALGYP